MKETINARSVIRVYVSVVLLTFIAIWSCRKRNEGNALKDLAVFKGDQLVLIYLDNDSNQVIRAECPPVTKDKRSSVSGFNMRDYCKEGISHRLGLVDFEKNLERVYLKNTGLNQLFSDDRSIMQMVVRKLFEGPPDADRRTLNRGANAVDLDSKKVLDPYLTFNDPGLLHIYLQFLASVDEAITGVDTNPQVPAVPKPDPTPPRELQPIKPTPSVLLEQELGIPENFYVNGSFEISNEQPFDGVVFNMTTKDGKPCRAVPYNVSVLTDRGDWHSLYMAPSQIGVFLLPTHSRHRFTRLQLGVVNLGEEHLNCLFRVDGHVALKELIKSHEHREIPTMQNRDRLLAELMGTRNHRLNHYLWHSARNTWNHRNTTSRDRQTLQQMRIVPPRPLHYNRDGTINRDQLGRTAAGEDFLYMHRQMIATIKQRLGSIMYKPWTDLPGPSSREFPIFYERILEKTSEGLTRMQNWSKKYRDANYLRGVSLSKMGIDVEFDIHNLLHTRFSDTQEKVRPVYDDPIYKSTRSSRWRWDDPSYNHLSDSYSAHVHPTFWRIHQWVDERIEQWLRVHNYNVAMQDCTGVPKCYQWQGTWMGYAGLLHHHDKPPSGVIQAGYEEHDHVFPEHSQYTPELGLKLSKLSYMSMRIR